MPQEPRPGVAPLQQKLSLMRLNEYIELGEVAAEGGYGTIVRATDLRDGAALAVKFPTQKLDDPSTVQRFEREARVLEKLSHPAIVRYVEHGVADDGTRWIAMEWLEGETIADRVRSRGRLSRAEIVSIAISVLSALEAAHAAGVTHRDLKPSNVFLVANAEGTRSWARLIDFGLAWDDDESRTHRLTSKDVVPGTPAYVAPELLLGATPTPASDQYALAITLIEALEGTAPFAHLSATDAMMQRVHPSAIVHFDESLAGAGLAAVLRRATNREPEQRYANAAEMRRALQDVADEPDADVVTAAAATDAQPADAARRGPWWKFWA
jgi:serine/threonine protein kinase